MKAHVNRSLRNSKSSLLAASIVIGVGMGGFVDGIVFHQLLQWHEMISAKLPPNTLLNKSINMFWDGVFHAFTWLTTAFGIGMLWNYVKREDSILSSRTFIGGLLLGFGLFNIVEGVIDHSLLKLHNVREISNHKELWNQAFLVFGLALVVSGWVLVKNGKWKSIKAV